MMIRINSTTKQIIVHGKDGDVYMYVYMNICMYVYRISWSHVLVETEGHEL